MNGIELVEKFNELENDNKHGKAILLVCEFLHRRLEVKKMEHINALQELYGELTPELNKLRTDIWESVKDNFYEIRKGINLKQFLEENYQTCKDYAKEFFAGDLYQATEYLYNQI